MRHVLAGAISQPVSTALRLTVQTHRPCKPWATGPKQAQLARKAATGIAGHRTKGLEPRSYIKEATRRSRNCLLCFLILLGAMGQHCCHSSF